MPNTRRLAGRFFCVLITLAVASSGFAAAPTLCQITSTVYLADGSPAQGEVVILWAAFTTADGQPIAAGQLTVQLSAQGQFDASLAPNAGASPAGTAYRVTYKLSDGSTSQEFWTVPATQTTTIGAIRSKLIPANVAAQVLTREWADAHYIDFSSGQTVAGPKTFTASPSVPTPQNANDAANKAYVDAAGGGNGNLSSPPPIGNVTPNTGAFTTLSVQTTNGIPNPANFPQSDPCAQINAAIGALPAAGGTVDARGFAPGQTCNATLNAMRPVTILFGAGTWTFNGNPGINITAPNVVISCPAATFQQSSATTLMSGAAAPLIANFADALVNGGNYHVADGTQVLNCTLDGANTGTFGIFAPAVNGMKIRGVHSRAFTAANIFAIAGQNDMYNTVSQNSGGDGVVWGADGHVSGMSRSDGNGGDGWHIVSGGNVLDGLTAWENKLYGLHVDGNEGGDWVAGRTYLEPKIVLPTSNNSGHYAYYTQQTGVSAGARPSQFCQTVGCTTRDGGVTWINVGNGNLYGQGTMEFYAKSDSINSANISQSNYANHTGDWDDIFIEGTPTMPAKGISLTSAKAAESAVPSYPVHGVHWKYVANSSAKDVQWSGGALPLPQQPQPDLGGMMVESSSLVQIDGLNCNQSYGPCLSLLTSNDVVASLVMSSNGGTTGGPAANVIQIDASSHDILVDGVTADDSRSPALQRGIDSSGSHIVVRNEKYGNLAAGDNGTLMAEELAANSVQWSTAGSPVAAIDPLGSSTANFPVMDVRFYGVKGDGMTLTTCTGVSGSANVACTGATFTSGDIGKMVNFVGAGASGNPLVTTVAGCAPMCPLSTVVLLAANVVMSSNNTFFYGTDNTAAWCSMMNCTNAAGPNGLYTPSPGRRVFVPRGTYFFSDSIGSRNGDQIVGADQSATEMMLFNSDPYHEFLYLGAYNSAGTWTLDAGGLENGVRGILFSAPLSGAQVCVEALKYSGFNIDHNWFECGTGVQVEGSIGSITDNTFDSNTWIGVQLNDFGLNNFAYGTNSILIDGNKFYKQKLFAVNLNGSSGVTISHNDFNDSYQADVEVYSPPGYTTKLLHVVGNSFVTSPASSSGGLRAGYDCANNHHIAIEAALQDSVIANNTFNMGHAGDIYAANNGTLSSVVIANNAFKGACEPGECTNTCPGQTVAGQQGPAVDVESATSNNLTVEGNSFDSPGTYATRILSPVNVVNNTCHSPFTATGVPSQSYQNGCFGFSAATNSGSVASGNTTDSTSSAAVAAWNGATAIRFLNNQSSGSYDVGVFGSGTQTFSSWNERILNVGGATVTSQMDPTTGTASFAAIAGHEYFVSKFSSIQAAINAAYNNGAVLGTVIDDRTAPYTGPGFVLYDSVTLKLAATTYTINSTVTYNNGSNNVTAGIVLLPGGRLLGSGRSTNHGTILQPANGLNADLVATSTVGTGTANPQWWHWGEIGNLRMIGNGTNQSAGDCLKIENMGEVASVHDVELSACYNHNFESIGYAATQSDIANITSNRAVNGSGVAFTNLAGVAVLNGVSGDCNQASLIAANFNAAGTLTIHGLKAEAESSICSPPAQDPVILASTTASNVAASIKIDGGYAFGTTQHDMVKSTGPGSIQYEQENFYLIGYTNILNDTVRGSVIANVAATTKQPVLYLSNGMVFGNQAFTFLPNTFMQGNPNGTPTEMLGAGSDSSTDIAAIGNGDNTKYYNGGLKFGTFNRTQYGQTPEYQTRMGWRWTNPGYDTNTWTFIPIWATGDTSARWIGDPNVRWPEIYAVDVNATSATLGTLNVTTCNGCGGSPQWGSIGGTLSNQTDLQGALNAKANTASLAVVATSGSYNDLSNKPVIPAQGAHLVSGTLQGVTSQLTGTGADQNIYSATLPAGSFAAGQGVKCSARWTHSSTSTAVTYKWTLGSTTVTYGSLTSASQNFGSEVEIFTVSALASQVINVSPIIGGTTILAGPSNGNPGSENLANASTVKFTFNMPNTDWVKGSTFYCQTIQ